MKLMIAYKVAPGAASSHYHAGGLAVNAVHTAEVLRYAEVDVVLAQVKTYEDLAVAVRTHEPTHIVVEAIWLTVSQVQELAQDNPETQVVVRAHSKMGFLQVEPEAITVMRQIINLGQALPNVSFSSNNVEFAEAVTEAFGPCLYLPNLYDVASAPRCEPNVICRTISIASFGANRLLKLHPSAALAALQISRRLGKGLDFYINIDRTPGGESVRRSVKNLLVGFSDVRLFEVGWQDSETFKKTIAGMDLVIQLSATETFCMVAADAIASGVPVVGSPAITWIPETYQADADNTGTVVDAGIRALKRPARASREQTRALHDYLDHAQDIWLRFLGRGRRRLFCF